MLHSVFFCSISGHAKLFFPLTRREYGWFSLKYLRGSDFTDPNLKIRQRHWVAIICTSGQVWNVMHLLVKNAKCVFKVFFTYVLKVHADLRKYPHTYNGNYCGLSSISWKQKILSQIFPFANCMLGSASNNWFHIKLLPCLLRSGDRALHIKGAQGRRKGS